MTLFIVFLFISLSWGKMLPGKEEMDFKGDQVTKLKALQDGLDAKLKADRYLGHDITQKKYLRYHEFDVAATKAAMENSYKWDSEVREKTLVSDKDYPGLKEKIGGNLNAVDKDGRHILYLDVNKWAWWVAEVETDGMDKWKSTFYRMMDEVWKMTVERYEKGDSHTRFSVIANYQNWDADKGTSVYCMAQVAVLALNFETRWPGMKAHVVIINTPASWKVILDLIKPIFSEETNELLNVQGEDKAAWRKELEMYVDDAELKKLAI